MPLNKETKPTKPSLTLRPQLSTLTTTPSRLLCLCVECVWWCVWINMWWCHYLSLPTTWKDLTQDHDPRSFYDGGLWGGRARAQVIGSLSAMWTRWAFWTWIHSIYYVIPERMSIHSLKVTRVVKCYPVISMLFTHPRVVQLKLGAIQPRIWHWYPIRHECQTAQLKAWEVGRITDEGGRN